MDDDIKIMSIARGTAGFSGAELSNLVNTAALKVPTAVSFMLRSLLCGPLQGLQCDGLNHTGRTKAALDEKDVVSMADQEYAKDKIIMGAERKSAVISEKSKQLTAYHEVTART